ncbi:MAG: M48 family metallopeptidase [Proteobacteria bacterium]|nr:M48 family metallopeptidase [Pseudomonadota bacterium]
MDAATLRARWFDGRSSQARPVLLRLAGDRKGRASLRLHPLDAAGSPPLDVAPGEFSWPDTWEPSGAAPRMMVDLGLHGSVEVEGRKWEQALDACGARAGMAQRLQRRWPLIAGALLCLALVIWAFTRWGAPWVAGQLARFAPLSWERSVSQDALNQLEKQGVLKPSRIARARQSELQLRFAALSAQAPATLRPSADYAPPMEVQFRSGMGANAFALPGGVIVMTDAMVELAARDGIGDEALMGVLAHEAGHVLYRHGTRRVIELGILNAGSALVLGDASGLAATGGTLLAALAYSRDHEREADCFAIALMQATQQPLAPMATLLRAADKAHADAKGAKAADLNIEWLQTHPDTAGRAAALEAGQGASCARR